MTRKQRGPAVITAVNSTRADPRIICVSLTDTNIAKLKGDGGAILLKPEETGVETAVIVTYGGATASAARKRAERIMSGGRT